MIVGGGKNEMASDWVLMFPAISEACTLTVFAPIARVSGQLKAPACTFADTPLQVTVETPDKGSETFPAIVIPEVVMTAPFAGDVMLSTGSVLSRLTVSDADMEFPATSVAVPEIT